MVRYANMSAIRKFSSKWLFGHVYFYTIFCVVCEASSTSKSSTSATDVHSYLERYGYLPPTSSENGGALIDSSQVTSAIKSLQKFGNIPQTGIIDNKTMELLQRPRCSLPDKIPNRRVKRYNFQGQKWLHHDLTWSLQNYGRLNRDGVRRELYQAFKVWSNDSPLTFQEVVDPKANIVINFETRDHGDGFPFDGKGHTLAHAFFPSGYGSVDAHFDTEENWGLSDRYNYGETNLFSTAVHEFGHSLGLSHSNVEDAIMHPWYKFLNYSVKLSDDDVQGIRVLYGYGNPKTNPSKPVDSGRTPTTPPYYPHENPRIPESNPTPGPKYPSSKNPVHHPPTGPPNKPPRWPSYPSRPTKPTEILPTQPDHNSHPSTVKPYPPIHHPYRPTNPIYNSTRAQPPLHDPTPDPTKKTITKIAPDTCDTSYDAVSMIRGELYIFKDEYFWRLRRQGEFVNESPSEIHRMWHQLMSPNFTRVDAVYERFTDRKIVFFIGNQMYVFEGTSLVRGYPRPITDLGISSTVKKIDAAFVWTYNNKTYLFSGADYWRISDETGQVEWDYPRNIQTVWKGLVPTIDAAFNWIDGRTYFFKGKGFWKYHDRKMMVWNKQRMMSAPFWMGCRNMNNGPENEIDDYDETVEAKPKTLEVLGFHVENYLIMLGAGLAVLLIISAVIFGVYFRNRNSRSYMKAKNVSC